MLLRCNFHASFPVAYDRMTESTVLVHGSIMRQKSSAQMRINRINTSPNKMQVLLNVP